MSKVIMIAGMHRSGTSLSTNLLRESGLFVGDDLMNGGFDNKKGHFEDYEFVKLHEDDLKKKGCESTGLKGLKDKDYTFEVLNHDRINSLLEDRNQYPFWGWKDPRSTLYISDWKNKVPELKVIAIYRNYDEVVNSLSRRYWYKIKNQVNYSKLRRIAHFMLYPIKIQILKYQHYKAWIIYNERILNFKKQFPQDILLYELNDFVKNYNLKLNGINNRFQVDLKHLPNNDIFNPQDMKHFRSNGFRCYSKKKLDSVLLSLKEHTDE